MLQVQEGCCALALLSVRARREGIANLIERAAAFMTFSITRFQRAELKQNPGQYG
jgi:hypothetical protein